MGRGIAQRVDRLLRKYTLHADGRPDGGHNLRIQHGLRERMARTLYAYRQPCFGLTPNSKIKVLTRKLESMKPIQEYTKQEKLAAILEYNPCRTERNAILRYPLAVRRDNAEEIAYFEGFGDSVRKIILNVRTYERGLLFGYTAKQFDKCGWIRGMLPIVERIELDILNTIHIGQSIDGTYAVTVDWSTGGAGSGSHPSVWDEPIADYRDAVKRGIAELEKRYAYAWEHISDSCNYNARKIRQLTAKLKEVKQHYLDPKQLSLFDCA